MKHQPVMLSECIDALVNNPDGCYIDGTIGGGGHCKEILNRLSQKGRVLGFDRDKDSIDNLRSFSRQDHRLTLIHDNFSEMSNKLSEDGINKVDGILLDLGISSSQLDKKERGFSFLKDGPLDMRMNQLQELNAEQWLKDSNEEEIAKILYTYGEEKQSHKIAKEIVKFRKNNSLKTTLQLADLVEKVKGGRRGLRIHPATKTFQAIRIVVNNELGSIEKVLSEMIHKIYSGGRFVILTFHSLEDRIVKHFFTSHLKKEISLYEGGSKEIGNKPYIKWLRKKPLIASDNEIKINPRSRSAKLRAIKVEG